MSTYIQELESGLSKLEADLDSLKNDLRLSRGAYAMADGNFNELKAENARLTAALAEKNVELYGIRACGEKARRKIELPDGRPDNSDAALWERACAYWSSNALAIQKQLAEQDERLLTSEHFKEEFAKIGGQNRDRAEKAEAQLASQQEVLSAAADALKFYADESHWDDEVTASRGEDEFHATLNDRTMFVGDRNIIDYADGWDVAKAALARVNACLPDEAAKHLETIRDENRI